MPALRIQEASYLRRRVREELGRSRERGYQFALVRASLATAKHDATARRTFTDGQTRFSESLRTSDVLADVGGCTLVALLVETDRRAARAGAFRILSALAKTLGHWNVDIYHFPQDQQRIESLKFLPGE